MVLDLVDLEETGPPSVFAIDCNNLGVPTKEQFRGTEPGCRGEHRTPWCSSSVAADELMQCVGVSSLDACFPVSGGGVHGLRPRKRVDRRLRH